MGLNFFLKHIRQMPLPWLKQLWFTCLFRFPHGIGKSLHAGMVVVADGTDMMGERLRRVLTTDPGTGVMRHADAGYEIARAAAREHELNLPSLKA